MLLPLLLGQGTAGPGLQPLTPARFDNSSDFFAPTVTRGAVTLTASRFDNAQTFYAATVLRGAVTLNATRFDNAQTFYTPTVGRGAVTLTPARLDNAQTFYSATVSQSGGTQTLLPSLYTNDQTFYAPAVGRGAVVLAAGLVSNTQTFYAPSVAVGAVSLAPARVDNTQTFYAPTVGQAGFTQYITFPDWVDPGWVEPGWVAWPYFNQNQFFSATVAHSTAPPAEQIDVIGGFAIPTRQQMRDMAQKQRIALGILPKPIQRKAKTVAKAIARIVSEGGTRQQVQKALNVIPQAQRVEAMNAVQIAYAYYMAIQYQTQAQQEIARIQAREQEISKILAEIERTSIIQREEDDIAFLLMQVIMAE